LWNYFATAISFDDGLRRGAWIGGGNDWPANHQEVGAGANRFRSA